jgi:hypothetical protein
MPLDSNPEPNFSTHDAKWVHHEDADAVRLQIELGNDHAVTLSCSKNGSAPSVVLWHGNGEHQFNDTSRSPSQMPDRFRQWLEDAARRQ